MAKPNQGNLSTLKQLSQCIPPHLTTKVARETGVDQQARTFTPWSHVLSLMYCQVSHSISLNDVCDAMGTHSGKVSSIRGATPPKRNTFSNANRTRNPEMAEKLFWETLAHLRHTHPKFGPERRYDLLPRRFKRAIHAIDSSTISLVANCMDWAKHRRRKAAAKLHLRLDLQTFLPRYAIVEKAKHHDSTRAMALAAGLESGEIAVFDKAYIKYDFLKNLTDRGVFWVARAKSNMQYETVEEMDVAGMDNVIFDQVIKLTGVRTREKYPDKLRLIKARVEVNGKLKTMTFLTNNMEWSANSICDLYRCRWAIEVFFKEMKQTLQLGDFLGHNENAVRWQIWTALLTHLLFRFLAYRSKWSHSFRRLFTVVRAILWHNFNLIDHLRSYGTASPPPRMRATPDQAYLPGFG